jgi:hypothetical protein
MNGISDRSAEAGRRRHRHKATEWQINHPFKLDVQIKATPDVPAGQQMIQCRHNEKLHLNPEMEQGSQMNWKTLTNRCDKQVAKMVSDRMFSLSVQFQVELPGDQQMNRRLHLRVIGSS